MSQLFQQAHVAPRRPIPVPVIEVVGPQFVGRRLVGQEVVGGTLGPAGRIKSGQEMAERRIIRRVSSNVRVVKGQEGCPGPIRWMLRFQMRLRTGQRGNGNLRRQEKWWIHSGIPEP